MKPIKLNNIVCIGGFVYRKLTEKDYVLSTDFYIDKSVGLRNVSNFWNFARYDRNVFKQLYRRIGELL